MGFFFFLYIPKLESVDSTILRPSACDGVCVNLGRFFLSLIGAVKKVSSALFERLQVFCMM